MTDAEFIKIWNDSETAEEAALRSKMEDGKSASTRAWRIRTANIYMKNMQFTRTNIKRWQENMQKGRETSARK